MARKDAIKHIILYFIAGSVATKEDEAIIDAIEAADTAHVVKQRNGLAAQNDSLEACDGVAGPAIPERYFNEYPLVSDAGVWSEPRTVAQEVRDFTRVSGAVADEVGSAAIITGPTNPINPDQQTQQNTDPDMFGNSGFRSGN